MKKKVGYIAAQRIRGGTGYTRPLRFLDQQALYVDPGGTGEYTTIQAAINAIKAGPLTNRVIMLAPGTYIENLSFSAFPIAGLTIKGLGAGPVKVQGSVAAGAVVVNITGLCTGMVLTFENIEFEQLSPATNILACNATGGIDVAFMGCKFTAQANTDLVNWVPGGNSTLRISGGLRGKREYCLCAITIAATAGAVQAVVLSDIDLGGALTLNDADMTAVIENFKVGGNFVATAVNAADGAIVRNSHIVGSVTVTAGQVWFHPDVRADGAYVAGMPNIWRVKQPRQTFTTIADIALTNAEALQYATILINGIHAVTVPAAAAAIAGAEILITSANAGGSVVCAAGFGGAGAEVDTIPLGIGESCHLYCDGTNWYATVLNPRSVLQFGITGAVAGGAAEFMTPGSAATSALEITVRVTRSGLLRRLYVQQRVAPGGAVIDTFTVRVNGVDTTIICTIDAANVQGADIVNTAVVAAGDEVSIRDDTGAGSVSADIMATVEVA